MSEAVTVDASVFVNAFSPTEAGSDRSWEFIHSLKEAGTPVIVPALLLPEIATAIARRQDNTALGLQLVQEVRDIPTLTIVPLDESLAEQAVEIAVNHRLRGSDAVYAAVAARFGTGMVTLDREQLARLEGVVPVREPGNA
jgi:predicted nucleic acid-binding protein